MSTASPIRQLAGENGGTVAPLVLAIFDEVTPAQLGHVITLVFMDW